MKQLPLVFERSNLRGLARKERNRLVSDIEECIDEAGTKATRIKVTVEIETRGKA